MIGPIAIAVLGIFAVYLVLLVTRRAIVNSKPAPQFDLLEEPNYPNFSDLARSLPEDNPLVQAINLPEEKFAPKEYTRDEILSKAQDFVQEYATKYPLTPFITADFINHLLSINNYPVLGKYASGFFRNKKMFASTSMQIPSSFPSAKRRIIKVYRYIGPLARTAVN